MSDLESKSTVTIKVQTNHGWIRCDAESGGYPTATHSAESASDFSDFEEARRMCRSLKEKFPDLTVDNIRITEVTTASADLSGAMIANRSSLDEVMFALR